MADAKYGEFVGVDNVYVALLTKDDTTEYQAGTPVYFAPAAEISAESETESNPTYYDNVPGFNYVSEGVTTINCTFSGVPADVYAKFMGKYYDEDTGLVYDDGEPNPPDVALGFRLNRGPAGHRYYWYLKGNFSGGAEEAASKSSSVDVRTYQMTYTALATTFRWEYDGELRPVKRIFGDDTDASFTDTQSTWFAAVKTPPIAP
jgi:phi13 family phage major tail protein